MTASVLSVDNADAVVNQATRLIHRAEPGASHAVVVAVGEIGAAIAAPKEGFDNLLASSGMSIVKGTLTKGCNSSKASRNFNETP